MSRIAAISATSARLVLHLATPAVRASYEREIALTVGERCREVLRTQGAFAAAGCGLREVSSVARMAMASRVGRNHRAIGPSAGGRTPARRPSMLFVDLRHARRRVLAHPGTSLVATAMLALAVGISTSTFAVVDALLVRPAPFRDPGHLAHLRVRSATGGRRAVEPAVLRAWRQSGVLEAAEGLQTASSVIDGDRPAARMSASVSPGIFAMLGARPLLGRVFTSDEGRPESRDRVLLAATLWRDLFGSDRAIVGRSVRLDGHPVVVVGVMPDGFRFPEWNTELWTPFDFDTQSNGPIVSPRAYVRFAPGVPEADVLRTLTDIAHHEDPRTEKQWAERISVVGQHPDRQAELAVLSLGGGVALVFLVLCLNVASLMLARFAARRREFGMCAALGGSRWRLLREAACEGALLGGMGSVAGLVLTWGLVTVAKALLPPSLAIGSLNPIDIDLRAMGAAVAAGLAAVVLSAMLPAWLGTARTASEILRSGGARGSTEPRGARLVSRSLLTAQIALACALLVAGTLLVRSFINLSGIERGFRTDGIVTVELFLDVRIATDKPAREALSTRVREILESLPGVEQTTAASASPMTASGLYFDYDLRVDAAPDTPVIATFEERRVGPEYFAMYGVAILRGRAFVRGDPPNAVVLGERLASQLWPSTDAVGRTFLVFGETYRVVGVAQETGRAYLDWAREKADAYFTADPGLAYGTFALQCGSRCPSEGVVRARLLEAGPAVIVSEVTSLEDAYRYDLSQPRATAALGGIFAAIALVASAGGLFSVLTFAVTRRRREFGIRLALGSSPRAIRALILGDGLRVALVGLLLGCVLGLGLSRAVARLQYGVTPADPVTWALVILTIAATAGFAAWWPARDAMSTDPLTMLREE